jgi:hypothetical protein
MQVKSSEIRLDCASPLKPIQYQLWKDGEMRSCHKTLPQRRATSKSSWPTVTFSANLSSRTVDYNSVTCPCSQRPFALHLGSTRHHWAGRSTSPSMPARPYPRPSPRRPSHSQDSPCPVEPLPELRCCSQHHCRQLEYHPDATSFSRLLLLLLGMFWIGHSTNLRFVGFPQETHMPTILITPNTLDVHLNWISLGRTIVISWFRIPECVFEI